MYFFATGHVTRPGEIGRSLEEEKHVLAELGEQGVVREAFSPAAGHGVISILGRGGGQRPAVPGMLPRWRIMVG